MEFFEFVFANPIKHVGKLLVDFIAADKTQIITADVVKYQVAQKRFGLFFNDEILPSHFLVNFGLGFGRGADGILAVFQGGQNTGVVLTRFTGNYFNGFDFLFN